MKVHLETKCISPENTHIYAHTQPSFHTYPFEPWNKLKEKKKKKTVPWCLTASYLYSKKNKKNTDATTVHVFFTTNILGGLNM